MSVALQIPASEFSRRFGGIRKAIDKAGVIVVTSHNRVVGAYISVAELEHFTRLKRHEVQVLHVNEIDDELLSEIEKAEFGLIPK